ncbi:hypothetical protein [Streptomyces sp. NPDC003952]
MAGSAGLIMLGVMASGCGSPEPEEPVREPRAVSAAGVCGGTLLPASAGPSLERVLESSKFVVRDEDEDVSTAESAKMMEDAYRSGKDVRDKPTADCKIFGEERLVGDYERYVSALVRFKAFSKKAWSSGAGGETYDKGVLVTGAKRQRSIEFDCVSARVGSTVDIPLRITVTFMNQFPEGAVDDEAALVKDYLLLAHAAGLSMSKELGCADNGGLPDRPDDLPAMLT